MDGNSTEKGGSQLALITATRRGLTVRSRIMPIGAEPFGLSTWDGSGVAPFEYIRPYKLTILPAIRLRAHGDPAGLSCRPSVN